MHYGVVMDLAHREEFDLKRNASFDLAVEGCQDDSSTPRVDAVDDDSDTDVIPHRLDRSFHLFLLGTSNRANRLNFQRHVSCHSLGPNRHDLHVLQRHFVGTVQGILVTCMNRITCRIVPKIGKVCKGNHHFSKVTSWDLHIGLVTVRKTFSTFRLCIAKANAVSSIGRVALDNQLQCLTRRDIGKKHVMFALFGAGLNKARRVKKGNIDDLTVKETKAILDGKGSSRSPSHDGVIHLLPCVPRIVEGFQEDFAIFSEDGWS